MLNILFVLIVWNKSVWSILGPKNGVIDNRSHWFHRFAVDQLNKARNRGEGWVLFDFLGVKVRDPHAHISRVAYRWSEWHLFAIRKRKFN